MFEVVRLCYPGRNGVRIPSLTLNPIWMISFCLLWFNVRARIQEASSKHTVVISSIIVIITQINMSILDPYLEPASPRPSLFPIPFRLVIS